MSGDELVPLPDRGRLFRGEREVRLGDTDINGRLRLDALGRFLQDVANDDAREALGEDAAAWVVRRTVVDVSAWPRLGDVLQLVTFLGGVGARWAERRTTVRGKRGSVECASVWVHIDVRTGRPVALPERFLPVYGEVYGERKVSGKLVLPAPPADATSQPWFTRAADFDVLGHVNNAVYWTMAEERLAAAAAWPTKPPLRFELEHRLAIEPSQRVELAHADDYAWLVGDAGVVASARVSAR